jgi:hypothetical protein
MRHSHTRRVLTIALLLLSPACRKGEISVYRVPKEKAPALPMAAAGAAASQRAGIEWKAPAGWAEQPAASMRVGSFRAKGSNGKEVDISVVPLGGEAGGELANVNRWRGQLGLPPTDEAGLGQVATTRRLGAHEARVVEFANGQGQRLLAAILRNGATTWFFKASGDDAAVKDVKKAFLDFVASVRFKS